MFCAHCLDNSVILLLKRFSDTWYKYQNKNEAECLECCAEVEVKSQMRERANKQQQKNGNIVRYMRAFIYVLSYQMRLNALFVCVCVLCVVISISCVKHFICTMKMTLIIILWIFSIQQLSVRLLNEWVEHMHMEYIFRMDSAVDCSIVAIVLLKRSYPWRCKRFICK